MFIWRLVLDHKATLCLGSQGVPRLGTESSRQLQAAGAATSPRSRKALLLYEGSILLGACKWGLRLVTTTLGLFRAQEEASMWKLRIPWWTLKNLECLKGRQGKRKRLFGKNNRSGKQQFLEDQWKCAQWLSQGCGGHIPSACKARTISQELESLEVEQVLKILPLSHSKKGCILVTFCSKEWVPVCGGMPSFFLFVEHLFPRKMPNQIL